jgi:hypothetical protein
MTSFLFFKILFLGFNQAATPSSHNAITTGDEGWPPPSLLPTSLSHRALVVYLMSLDPVPLSLLLIPRLLHPGFCFGVLLYFFLSVSVFFEFFCSFCRSSSHQFRCPPSIAELLSCPHHDELPPCSSLYEVNVHTIGFFPCISFYLYSVMLLSFTLYFICYLLVIMLWP